MAGNKEDNNNGGRLLKKLRKFNTGFLKPNKVDKFIRNSNLHSSLFDLNRIYFLC